MSQKERHRYHLLKLVLSDKLTLRRASELMGVSYRHAKRLKRKLKDKGAKGLIHGNRGQPASNCLHQEIRERVIELSRESYAELNDSHFTQKLQEEHGVLISRETVRKLRRSAGIKPKRRRRPKRHHKRRPRKPAEGMMVQWDGSPHRWFGKEYPPCCLMAASDDATSRLLEAFFIEFECSFGYLKLLKGIVETHGLPGAIYQDRHSCLKRNDDHWSLAEQLAGEQDPTQVGWALRELGVTQIFAHTPQAKGRIERLFGVLQDRLMAEMSLKGIKDIKSANCFLHDFFIDDYNQRFAVDPKDCHPAWRKLPQRLDLDRVISFRYQATVANDNAVRLGGVIIDIPPPPNRAGYAKAKVEVRQLLDGSWRVYYKNKLIAQTQPTPLNEPIKARKREKSKTKATKQHTWIYMAPADKGDILPLQLRGHIDLA